MSAIVKDWSILLATAGVLALSGCFPTAPDLTGRPCPCAVGYICVAAVCIRPASTIDAQTDAPLDGSVVGCRVDSVCDDGNFCNGDERCDLNSGRCVSQRNPRCGDASLDSRPNDASSNDGSVVYDVALDPGPPFDAGSDNGATVDTAVADSGASGTIPTNGCAPWTENFVCGTSQYCRGDQDDFRCRPRGTVAVGASCGDHDQCQSGVCRWINNAGACYQPCRVSADCSSGLECEGWGVQLVCTAPSDSDCMGQCGLSQACVGYENSCLVPCRTQSDCSTGSTCDANLDQSEARCLTGLNQTCAATEVLLRTTIVGGAWCMRRQLCTQSTECAAGWTCIAVGPRDRPGDRYGVCARPYT